MLGSDAFHLAQEAALLANDKASVLSKLEIGCTLSIGLEARPISFVCRQALKRNQPIRNVVGALVRHPITDELAAAFGNDSQPIARLLLKALAFVRIKLISNETVIGINAPSGHPLL